ncbi:MAG: GAF domain-containing protein, partial [Roseiflexaceae bacterium]|nr:GAF domain-containing protein [Roseiflexaceae bacterium]
MQRPHYRSTLVRRALFAVLAGLVLLVLLLFGLIAVALWLLPPTPELAALAASAVAALPALQPLLLWALVALLLLLLAALALARWAVRPAETLLNAVTTLAGDAHAPGVGQSLRSAAQISKNFTELSDQLLRSVRELDRQNRTMVESVGRLEQLLAIGRDLSALTGSEQILARAAQVLREQGGYERAAAALVDGDELVFYGDQAAAGHEVAVLRVPLHNGLLAGQAALSGALGRCADLRAPSAPAGAPTALAARAELAMPVIHSGQVLAVLVVQSQRVNAFGAQDEEQLRLLAQILAGALAQSGLVRAEKSRRQMAEAIYRVAQTLGGVLQLERVPEVLLDQLAQMLPSERSSLLLISGGEVTTIAARGIGNNAVVDRSRTGLAELPLISEIVLQKRAIALPLAHADARYRPSAGADAAQSWLGTPLVRGEDVIGVLVLESDAPDRYGHEELAAMTAISHQAATALENARLYGEAQERAARLEVITELTKLVSNRDVLRELHGILRTAIHRIRRIVPCDYAALALYNAEDDSFSVEPVYDSAARDWALAAGERLPADGTPWQMACRTAGPVLQSDLAGSAFAGDRQLA